MSTVRSRLHVLMATTTFHRVYWSFTALVVLLAIGWFWFIASLMSRQVTTKELGRTPSPSGNFAIVQVERGGGITTKPRGFLLAEDSRSGDSKVLVYGGGRDVNVAWSHEDEVTVEILESDRGEGDWTVKDEVLAFHSGDVTAHLRTR